MDGAITPFQILHRSTRPFNPLKNPKALAAVTELVTSTTALNTMQKVKFKCEGCGCNLTAFNEDSGNVSPCPKCGAMMTIPYAGLARLPYIVIFLATFYGCIMLLLAGAPPIIKYLLFVVHAGLAYQRSVNIGHSKRFCSTACCLALVPLTFFYFAIRKTGAAKTNIPKKDFPGSDLPGDDHPVWKGPDQIMLDVFRDYAKGKSMDQIAKDRNVTEKAS
jgi:ribosomal protein S27E